MSKIILIIGGARSGKSSFAELLANHSPDVTYIATAQIFDQEMAERIAKHRLRRPNHWRLIEEPYDLERVLLSLSKDSGVVLLDCITLWLSNLILSALPQDNSDSDKDFSYLEPDLETKIIGQVEKLIHLAVTINPQVIIVSNEVGSGIVPANFLSRFYRDMAGRSNQLIAQAAEQVFMVVAGYPMEIKKSGQELLDRCRENGGCP